MADLPSRLDLYDIGRRYIYARAKRIDPEIVDTEGSDANLFVGSGAFMAHAVVRHLISRINAMLLDGAEREDLDRWAYDRYKLTRKGAAPAVATVRFFRTDASAGSGSINAGTKLNSLTGIEYFTTTAAVFGSGDLEATALARSTSAGKEYQVGANQIRRFGDAATLFDQTLQVNNDDKAAGGENAEGDDVFRERIRDFWASARRGTIGAIEFGARAVPGVESAQAFETISPITSSPARVVELFIADSSGVSNAALSAAVLISLLEYRAAGITVIVRLSIPEIVDVRLRLAFAGNVDTSILAAEIRAAVIAYINSLPVNAPLYRSELYTVLNRYKVDGLVVDEGTIVTPTGDLYPVAGTTFRVRSENVVVV